MRIKGHGTLATPALALFAVVAVGVAVLPVSAKAATQSDSIYLGKWCGSGTLEVTSLSPPAGSYVPFPNAFPDDVQGIAGPAAIIVGDGSLSFRPTGTSRVFSLTLSDGVLSGTLDSNHRHYSIMFKKC